MLWRSLRGKTTVWRLHWEIMDCFYDWRVHEILHQRDELQMLGICFQVISIIIRLLLQVISRAGFKPFARLTYYKDLDDRKTRKRPLLLENRILVFPFSKAHTFHVSFQAVSKAVFMFSKYVSMTWTLSQDDEDILDHQSHKYFFALGKNSLKDTMLECCRVAYTMRPPRHS